MTTHFDFPKALLERESRQLYRRRRVLETAQGAEVVVDGHACVAFCSNDYLGLANHPQVVTAFQNTANQYGVGAGASHLISGHMSPHHALEEELADFVGTERALLFSTGYMANLGVINAVVGRGDEIFADKLNHASLLDGALLSAARLWRYPHGDMDALERLLSRPLGGRRLLCSDGVFSMDGDLAPIDVLATLAAKNKARLLIDDAHGFGVLGEQGRGSLEQLGLSQGPPLILMATLGKALGCFGAFVAAEEALIETLIQLARTYVYTTALPPAVAEAARASLRLVRQDAARREQLWVLVQRFRHGSAELGLNVTPSTTPIQPLVLGDSQRVLDASAALEQRGFFVTAIRPPTVPVGSARLRITLSAVHTPEQVDRLLEALAEVCGHG
ncbi:MAG TPA: 8-amino-7-oxononanoate synthase [Acidiferrobacteraceae bacterium]|nr:8-amino-7-oxononanoate synthase [Acidiferrobacteraceae bacterium]